MKNFTQKILFLFILLSSFNMAAQRRGGQGKHNMFGLKLAMTHFDIKTNNFISTPGYGFTGGFSTRGDFYNNMDIQFGINISNNNFKVQATEVATSTSKAIGMSLLNAQVQLLFGYKIIGNNRNYQSKFKLVAEFGPVLQINSKMKLSNKDYEEYIIDKTTLTAKQLTNINGINFNGLAGLSIGAERFRVFCHYQYGVNNILKKLDKAEDNTQSFKGNISMFQYGVLIYF